MKKLISYLLCLALLASAGCGAVEAVGADAPDNGRTGESASLMEELWDSGKPEAADAAPAGEAEAAPAGAAEAEPAGEAEAAPAPKPALPPAGVYLPIARAPKELAMSLTEDQAAKLAEDALAYYIEKNAFMGLVLREDGTGERYYEDDYFPVLIKDGYYYNSYGGTPILVNGNRLITGVEGADYRWCIFFRLTEEQAGRLPEAGQPVHPNSAVLDIRTDTVNQLDALDEVVAPVIDAGHDPNEVYGEALKAVMEAAQEDARLAAEESAEAKAEETSRPTETFRQGQITTSKILELNGGSVPMDVQNGAVTFIGGPCTDELIQNEEDARRVVMSLVSVLGGDENTAFELWAVREDSLGNTYYLFQQMDGFLSIPGAVVKLAVNADGKMTAVLSNLVADRSGSDTQMPVDPSALSEIVRAQSGFDPDALTVHEELTEKVLLDLHPNPDVEALLISDNPEYSVKRLVWVVYTDNPAGDDGYPYLAHYVTMDGNYLYNLPVLSPGDLAARSGFDSSYVFRSMAADEWTGTVVYDDGHEETITVPVMRDADTGTWYLGDVERKIAVADAWPFLYDGFRHEIESSETNEWDNYHLITYYNVLSVWDYYHALGWTGTNGIGTPIIILTDMCEKNHDPIDNAYYMGALHGWEIFGFSSSNTLGAQKDIVAHEFSHGFSNNSMSYIWYMNETGAINEALSDILGNIFQSTVDPDSDPYWRIGESGSTIYRDMSDPGAYGQPAYVWDYYYIAPSDDPLSYNDNGGVHNNSSLLNLIAYRLWREGGMSLEETRLFWTSLVYHIVPGSDFNQLRILMPWLMKELGMEKYLDALKDAMDEVRLAENSLPEPLDEGRSVVVLQLPEIARASSGDWVLLANDFSYPWFSLIYYFAADYAQAAYLTVDEDGNFSVVSSEVPGYYAFVGDDGRTIQLVCPAGGKYIFELLHKMPGTMADSDHWMKYGEGGVWADDTDGSQDFVLYTIPEGYNVLSSEGLEEVIQQYFDEAAEEPGVTEDAGENAA